MYEIFKQMQITKTCFSRIHTLVSFRLREQRRFRIEGRSKSTLASIDSVLFYYVIFASRTSREH